MGVGGGKGGERGEGRREKGEGRGEENTPMTFASSASVCSNTR